MLKASSTTPSMTPVSATLDPTTGIAKRIAITSTASVEKPSTAAMIQSVRNQPRSADMDVCIFTLLRFSHLSQRKEFKEFEESKNSRNASPCTFLEFLEFLDS